MPAPSSPDHERIPATTRQQMRTYLSQTLTGQRLAWSHTALRHNTLSFPTPCPLCDADVADPLIGPAVFWDTSPLCEHCAREVAPHLEYYVSVVQAELRKLKGG